jgi:peptidyl-prolyl cis-trans isomerase C
MWRSVMGRLLAVGVLAVGSLPACDGCSNGATGAASAADAGAGGRLTPEQANQVLAKVGNRSITLGDFAAALERMDPFERMRYQTKDRRQALLDEMINVELLAREAERRGLDRRPETIELVRQFQRDELLARLRASLPRPADLSAADVSRYYQEHRAEFVEPEQRRGAEIVLNDAQLARQVLSEAAAASPDRWRELVQKHAPAAATPAASSTAPPAGDKTAARPPIDVPGDLGFLAREPDAAPVAQPPASDEVPPAVREALFRIAPPSGVYPELVTVNGRHHVVRLVSLREARQRSLAEVDTLIRLRLVERREDEAKRALLGELRRQTAVKVDEAALERIEPVAPATAPATP